MPAMRGSRWNSNAAAPNSRWSSAHAWALKKTADGTTSDSHVANAGTAAQQRRGARHDRLIITYARTAYQRSPRSFLRGAGRQVAQRAQERSVRRRVLACVRWATWHLWSRGRCAAALHLDPATLATWVRRWADLSDRLPPTPLGTKPVTCSPLQRRDVLDILAVHGTALGVAVLQDHFPELSRRDLGCLLHLARIEVDAVAAGTTLRRPHTDRHR